MEDAHATVLTLDEGDERSNAFFAVYDGHGGACYIYFVCVNFSILSKVIPLRNLQVKMSTRGS
jgi:hypothetical protein